MAKYKKQSGMSLMEVLVALAVILILISALVGVGSYVKTRAQLDLTKGMLETLSSALEQYYDDFGDFPFDTDVNGNGIPESGEYDQAALEVQLDGAVVANGGPILLPIKDVSSISLFYFLDKNPSSRSIAGSVADSLITNKEMDGFPIQLEQPAGSGNLVDLPRYIDPWKMSIRYVYLPGTAFPALTSAGPDRIFDTPDDVTSK